MSKKRKLPKIRPNPYMLLTGAVAASATALLAGGADEAESHAYHQFMLGETSDGGKMYDDILAGQCAQGNWSCYMTMTASIDPAINPAFHQIIDRALDSWSESNTTLYYNRIAPNPENDLQFLQGDLPGAGLGLTVVENYHHQLCPLGSNDCEDTVENPPPSAHQPEKWWYAYVVLDPSIWNSSLKEGIISHEMGHVVGLAHQPIAYPPPEQLRDGICDTQPPFSPNPPSIEDYDCVDAGAIKPKQVDECGVNHVEPLLYGDGGPVNDPAQDPHANAGCNI
jgi:hypothetical protein